MKSGSRRSRRHRNPQPQEQNESPFFSKAGHAPETQGSQPFFQAKLTIGQPGDPYEQEADAVANRVVDQKQGGAPAAQEKGISSIQRLATPEEEKMPATNDGRMKEDKAIQEKPQEEEPVQKMEAPEKEEEAPVQKMDAAPEEEEPVQKMEAPEKEEEAPVQKMDAAPEEEESVQKMEAPEKEEEPPVQKMDAAPEEEEPVQKAEAPEKEEEAPVQKLDAAPEEEEPVQKAEAPEKEEEPPVQAKPNTNATAPPTNLSSRLAQRQGKGKPLPRTVRSQMEQGIGADFSDVNIHTDTEAVALNEDLHAQAFTQGKDIYFDAGKYNPDNAEGQRLLAHELTHVVQQDGVRKKSVQRKENVVTKDEKEANEAQQIMERIKTNYGIDVNSDSGVAAIKKDYSMVPKAVLDTLKTKDWEFKELVALEKALDHFAPILGAKRAESTRAGVDQEATSVSKLDQAIDTKSATGVLDTTTMGEYFKDSKNFSMFTAGTNSTQDFTDNKKQLEGTAIHEIAHGLMKYALPDFVTNTKFWSDASTKSGAKDVEAPITTYGEKSAGEDFSEAVMYYFMEPATLKDGVSGKKKGEAGNPCPERHAFIDKTVKAWSKPKTKPETSK